MGCAGLALADIERHGFELAPERKELLLFLRSRRAPAMFRYQLQKRTMERL